MGPTWKGDREPVQGTRGTKQGRDTLGAYRRRNVSSSGGRRETRLGVATGRRTRPLRSGRGQRHGDDGAGRREQHVLCDGPENELPGRAPLPEPEDELVDVAGLVDGQYLLWGFARLGDRLDALRGVPEAVRGEFEQVLGPLAFLSVPAVGPVATPREEAVRFSV